MKKTLIILSFIVSSHCDAKDLKTDWQFFSIRNYFMNKPCSSENVRLAIDLAGIQHAEIVFKQAILESGHFRSHIARHNNNLFGMKLARRRTTLAVGVSSGHAVFLFWIDSVLDYKIWQGDKAIVDYYDYLTQRGYNPCKTYSKRLMPRK